MISSVRADINPPVYLSRGVPLPNVCSGNVERATLLRCSSSAVAVRWLRRCMPRGSDSSDSGNRHLPLPQSAPDVATYTRSFGITLAVSPSTKREGSPGAGTLLSCRVGTCHCAMLGRRNIRCLKCARSRDMFPVGELESCVGVG